MPWWQIRFIYFVTACQALGSPSAPVKKRVYLFCGRMPGIGELLLAFVTTTVLACQPISPSEKIGYIYFVAACRVLGSSNLHLSKSLCWRASPSAPVIKSGIFILWSRAWSSDRVSTRDHLSHLLKPLCWRAGLLSLIYKDDVKPRSTHWANRSDIVFKYSTFLGLDTKQYLTRFMCNHIR